MPLKIGVNEHNRLQNQKQDENLKVDDTLTSVSPCE